MTAETPITLMRAVADEDFTSPNIEIQVLNKLRIYRKVVGSLMIWLHESRRMITFLSTVDNEHLSRG